jgi:predicted RNase H-like nuclease (RuvC/YqgF family)
MTVLGKVLVFVNLLFSVLVAFFITQSYAKRTDWSRAYKDATTKLQQAETQRDQYMADKVAAVDGANKEITALRGNLDACMKDKGALNAKINELNGQVEKQNQTLAKYNLSGTGVQNEVERLSKQAEGLQKMLADANKRLDDQAKMVEDFRQRAVKAEIDNRSLIARNNELLNVVEEKEKELIRQKTSPGGAVTTTLASNPPPGDVSGRVKNYDPTSGLLTLTIGSDAGILKGHTLYVYRLEPNGQYIGQVRILEVRPNEAVGKMVSKPRAPVQVNDKVANKIS